MSDEVAVAHRVTGRRNGFESDAATFGAGVLGGFVAGVLVGGVGGRLAMMLLRFTSSPELVGLKTDDGFTVGRFSSETIFLLGVTAGLGILGGVLYLIVRGWIPARLRIASMSIYFAAVGGAGIIGPSEFDFSRLSPLRLAIALFIVIPAVFGVVTVMLVERLIRPDSFLRQGRWWFVGLLPLILINVVGLLLALLALAVGWAGERAPSLRKAWESRATAWIGRAVLIATAGMSAVSLGQDVAEIL
jgi:hypothetical protein